MTRQNLSIGLALFMTLFLAACSDQEDVNVGDQNAKEAKARAVKVIEAQKQSFAPIVETLGSLKAKSETTLASEASGTISHIYVKEGDYVKNGDLLLQFDPNNNLTTVSLENARQAFNNSDSLYNLTLSSAESAKKTAELSVEQAVISLETAKKSDSSTDISVEEQIDSVETGIENARVDLELAEKALKDEKENMAKAEKNFMQNAKNTFSSSRVIFLSDLQKADEILGVTDQNSNINNHFEGVLAARNPALLPEAKIIFKRSNAVLKELDTIFDNVDSLEKANEAIERTVEIADSVRDLLDIVDEILQNTITTANFPSAELAGMKADTSGRKTALEGQITALTSVSQGISDFLIQSPQAIKSRELTVEVKKNALKQAKHNLENTKASLDIQKIGTSSQIEIAEKTLKSANLQLESVMNQNKIAIQNAKSARDSAKKQLESALLSYSKLNVTSPVSGVVISSMKEIGDTVGQGVGLFIVAEVDTLIFETEIAAEYASKLHLVDEVEIYSVDENNPKKGKIVNIAPNANEQTRKVKIEIEVDNSDKTLFANTFAKAKVKAKEQEGILAIPLKALFSKNPPTVYVITDNIVEKRIIHTGNRGSTYIEVLSGVEEGEMIVRENTLNLENGDKVEIIQESEEPNQEAQEQ